MHSTVRYLHLQQQHCKRSQLTHSDASSKTSSPTALYLIPCTWLKASMLSMPLLTGQYLQARLCEQEAATAEQSACAQQLQEAVETGKGKLAESAAFMQKLQDEQSRAREQIAEYAAQVMNKIHVLAQKLSMPTCMQVCTVICPDVVSNMQHAARSDHPMIHECRLFCNAQSHVTCQCNSSHMGLPFVHPLLPLPRLCVPSRWAAVYYYAGDQP